MSDHDAAPDPIDRAYVQAEAVLSDEAARAARRARVLEAVAREAEAAPAAPLPFTRRPAWRHGRWLAAAGVAGLGLILATQIYPPAWRQSRTASVAPAAPTPAASSPTARGALPAPAAAAPSQTPPASIAAVPRAAPPVLIQPVPPPAPTPPAEPAPAAAAPGAFPAAAAPPAPPSAIADTTGRRESDQAGAAQSARAGKVPVEVSAFTGRSRDVQPIRPEALAGPLSDQAARLRAAAAAGRTTEVDTLLAQGVPVDASDADGNTALMESIRADHPAVAARLRGHGASLDLENRAGESARGMATAKGDAGLNQALGLAP